MNKVTKLIQFGGQEIKIETGQIARQATAAVMVSQNGTQVLVTVVAQPKARTDADFFPLTVNYQEKMYAAGRIPGGFLKREGRPADTETLTARLIDRPIRPLFPKGFYNEIQVVCTVMSINPEVKPDMLAMVGASAALTLSGVPFQGPMAGVRVGYSDGVYSVNPTKSDLVDSKLDLVVAGTEDAVLMVESEAQELSEEVMLGAVTYGHSMLQSIIQGIRELAEEAGKAKWDWTPAEKDTSLNDLVASKAASQITEAYQVADKQQRQEKLAAIKESLVAELVNAEDDAAPSEDSVLGAFGDLEKNIVRERVLAGEPRIDGRDRKTVRPISIETGILERAHGSVLFTRGETQAIVVATLGTERDAQILDSIHGEQKDRYTLHYNFPPYCVGETGMMGSPKRREIGHGNLARRATEWSVPSQAEFPYSLRIVSEITESNGSSSMASVCGASLAMMDAGVPVKAPVAGIAMGLVKENDRYAVLTDILGDEDHLGDMDFKVAGTSEGVTALQMDIKITGITESIMREALEQALEARLHILGLMNKAISAPRQEMSEYAPKIITMKIDTDKIKDVIGKGGSTIRSMTDGTGVSVDIDEDGTIKIFSADGAAAELVKKQIEGLTEEVEVGKVYEGKVSRIVDFGAFVNILPGKDGLVHISQISHDRVEKITDYINEGDVTKVKVLDIDRQGKVKLSMKALVEKPKKEEEAEGGDSDPKGDDEERVANGE